MEIDRKCLKEEYQLIRLLAQFTIKIGSEVPFIRVFLVFEVPHRLRVKEIPGKS